MSSPAIKATSFAERFRQSSGRFGSLVMGLDPSPRILSEWTLEDSADGLERFVDIAIDASVGTVGTVKPQSAFYERHGWKGIRALARLAVALRSSGIQVILDVKRGDVGSTNEAYADAYLGSETGIDADAVTVAPYLGFDALGSFFERAAEHGRAVFVVVRSTNREGRLIQEARDGAGLTVEARLISMIGDRNQAIAGGEVGPIGAVFGPTHEPSDGIDLEAMRGLFLAPGVGAQGATPADVAGCFQSCKDRVLPSASRSLLSAGPDPRSIAGAATRLSEELAAAFG